MEVAARRDAGERGWLPAVCRATRASAGAPTATPCWSCCDAVQIPRAGAAAAQVSARVLRRPAPAADDRDGAAARARIWSSPTSRPPRSTSPSRRRSSGCCGALVKERGVVGAAHHARPRHRLRDLRPRHRHVCRPGGGDGAGRRASSPHPRHPYTPQLLASLPDAQRRAARHPRRGPEPDRAARRAAASIPAASARPRQCRDGAPARRRSSAPGTGCAAIIRSRGARA